MKKPFKQKYEKTRIGPYLSTTSQFHFTFISIHPSILSLLHFPHSLSKNGFKTIPHFVCCGSMCHWSRTKRFISSCPGTIRGLFKPCSHHGRLLVLCHQWQRRHQARGYLLFCPEVCAQNCPWMPLWDFQKQCSVWCDFECHQGRHSPCCLQSLCPFCH